MHSAQILYDLSWHPENYQHCSGNHFLKLVHMGLITIILYNKGGQNAICRFHVAHGVVFLAQRSFGEFSIPSPEMQLPFLSEILLVYFFL